MECDNIEVIFTLFVLLLLHAAKMPSNLPFVPNSCHIQVITNLIYKIVTLCDISSADINNLEDINVLSFYKSVVCM